MAITNVVIPQFPAYSPQQSALERRRKSSERAMALSVFEMLVEVLFEFGTVLDTFVGQRQTIIDFSMEYGS